MSLYDLMFPQPVEGVDEFISGMQALGYDINPHHQVNKSHQDLMLAMAKRIDALQAHQIAEAGRIVEIEGRFEGVVYESD